ncbi:MAG TPA: methyltransferase [Hyphomicrobiaceae bacterium]|nr:methyltransferase [Hyphomicrobiaceae bacterium]
MAADEGFEVVGLGARGDGIAETAEGPRYLPFALPGERVRVDGTGLPQLLSAPSPERRAPRCRHFGVCGGCVAQHMGERLYADWKRGILEDALRKRGLRPELEPLRAIAAASRRRAVMTGRCLEEGSLLGYHPRDSDAVFEVLECPVLVPQIVAALPALRAIVAAAGQREVRLTVLATPAGLDVAVASSRALDAKLAARLAQIAAAERRLVRVTLDGETVSQRLPPALTFAGVEVCPPPGAFVQAVAEAESAIAEEVAAATAKVHRAADLFCGVGTLTFHLARAAAVAAFDSDAAAVKALQLAARHAKGLKPIEAKVRDLMREPLSARELDGFDAVVFDPPRAGAMAQAGALARSRVPIVVAVSCYPGTLARDLRILVDGGYRLQRVVPIDQFLFSAHVEAVAYLRR